MSVTLSFGEALSIVNSAFEVSQVIPEHTTIIDCLFRGFFYDANFSTELKSELVSFIKRNDLIHEFVEKASLQQDTVNLVYTFYADLADIVIDYNDQELLYTFVQAFETDDEELAFIEIQADLIKDHNITEGIAAPDVVQKIVLCNIALCQINNDHE